MTNQEINQETLSRPMNNGAFHTNDLALVTYLHCRSYSHTEMRRPARNVVWYFENTKALQDELDEYRRGEALVDPIEFMKALASVRGEMFEYIKTLDV